jgi:hypothetical protein
MSTKNSNRQGGDLAGWNRVIQQMNAGQIEQARAALPAEPKAPTVDPMARLQEAAETARSSLRAALDPYESEPTAATIGYILLALLDAISERGEG